LKIAIIGGAGKMGKWFAGLLVKEGHEVIITGRNQSSLKSVQKELRVSIATNAEAVAAAEVVLISVGIDSFKEVVREIAPHIREEQIIFDITSIKETPVEVMHRYFKSANLLGMHPLFGPGAKDLSNQNFVLTPTNEKENGLARKVEAYLKSRGARVTLMTPRKHDEMMSVVLGLAHFISIVAADTLLETGKLAQLKAVGGSTYRVLTTLVESVVSEDPELYATLQMHLPYVTEVEASFQANTAKWAELVKNHDKAGFIKNMTALKSKFARNSSSFGQAYENMYKIMEWL
jgi:prephenate dehydrogenase